jgi:hypothetical protein
MVLVFGMYNFNFDGRWQLTLQKSKPHEENANIHVVLLNGFY